MRDWQPTSYSDVAARLLAVYTPRKAGDLVSFWHLINAIGADAYRAQYRPSAATWGRRMRDLRAAGVTLGSDTNLERLRLMPSVCPAAEG